MTIPIGDSATQGVDFKALADLAVNTLAEHGIKAQPVQFASGHTADSIEVIVLSRWNPDILEVCARERRGSGQPTYALTASIHHWDIPDFGGVEGAVKKAAAELARIHALTGWPTRGENQRAAEFWVEP